MMSLAWFLLSVTTSLYLIPASLSTGSTDLAKIFFAFPGPLFGFSSTRSSFERSMLVIKSSSSAAFSSFEGGAYVHGSRD